MVTPIFGQKWPQRVWIVRHGPSAGNVARDRAYAAAPPLIDIATRDEAQILRSIAPKS